MCTEEKALPNPAKNMLVQIKRDFLPVIRFLESAEIVRGKQNDFDDPVIGDFAKYAVSPGEIFLLRGGIDHVGSEARRCLLEMICNAINIKMDDVSELDFEIERRDPRVCMMNLGLRDGTKIMVPLIDRSATKEE